jgi:hypothetical protein
MIFKIKASICIALVIALCLLLFLFWINEDNSHPTIPKLGKVRYVLVSHTEKRWCITDKVEIAAVLDFLTKQSNEKWKQWQENKRLFDSYQYSASLGGSTLIIGYGNSSLFASESEHPKDNMYKSISAQDEEKLLQLTGVMGDKKYIAIFLAIHRS